MRALTSRRGRQTLKPELGQPIADEHFLLEDNKYIADVLADIRERKSRDTQSKARARARPSWAAPARASAGPDHASFVLMPALAPQAQQAHAEC
jgi:hypothetical protein